jgi:glycosyltransferase involved in cell wall biosynthesis
MPSPFDWICIFKKGGIKTIKSIVHDHKTHQGDNKWKERLAQSFWRIMKPDIITLSEYVTNNLRKSDIEPIFTLFHPYFIDDVQIIDWSKRKYDIGVFGRFKSYQGINNLECIRGLLIENELKVVYCGGSRKVFEDTKNGEEFVYGKISDKVFFNTMANTRFVLLPYVEATQSGIIPNAQALGCKIITTNVGGIRGQDIYNDFKIIELNNDSLEKLFKTLDRYTVNEDVKYYPDSISPRKFIDKIKENLGAV